MDFLTISPVQAIIPPWVTLGRRTMDWVVHMCAPGMALHAARLLSEKTGLCTHPLAMYSHQHLGDIESYLSERLWEEF